jgi:deoxyribodipyrimidine photo-lyase
MENKPQHPVSVCWLRRDLRLYDHRPLYHALSGKYPVVLLFIFDIDILKTLEQKKDSRIHFIHHTLKELNKQLARFKTSLVVKHGKTEQVWKELLNDWHIHEVFAGQDVEPYAKNRDRKIEKLLRDRAIPFHLMNDHVIYSDVFKDNGEPYLVFTPYKKKWLERFNAQDIATYDTDPLLKNFNSSRPLPVPELSDLGFESTSIAFPDKTIPKEIIKNYHNTRDFPALRGTTRLGVHLRFGTISIRECIRIAKNLNQTWLSELIWREFFITILDHFPYTIEQAFKEKYNHIRWQNNRAEFEKWCHGQTGYPIVDAGMRQLNSTGFMHNRVRMIVASFLTKHLLIDWQWGENYFAGKLLDYEQAANVGNWQWAAGTGVDAVPYFRIFNPYTQAQKFDPQQAYISQWVPEIDSDKYPSPMVNHSAARIRALETYKSSIS